MKRVAVIGTGFGARVVAPAFAAAGCAIVGVVSAARPEARCASSITRPEVDLVSVHSPPFLHAEHVRAAIAAGKDVLCDKPFAMNAREAADLEAEAADAGIVALCNFEFRYAPARERLRGLVRDGALGTIEHVQWTHLSSGSRVPLRPWGWLFDRELGGGWIGAWASHAVDALRFLFGEVVDVRSRPRTDIGVRPDRDGVMHVCTAEDGLTAWLELEGGVTVAIDSSFAARGHDRTAADRCRQRGHRGAGRRPAADAAAYRRERHPRGIRSGGRPSRDSDGPPCCCGCRRGADEDRR